MHGRQIFGGLVPYDKVWRAGANQATLLHTDLDLTIGSLAVPKGDYSIYILPEEKQWTLIINTQTGQWGINDGGATTEDPAKDLGRVGMKHEQAGRPSRDVRHHADQGWRSRRPGDGVGEHRSHGAHSPPSE